VLSSAPRAAVYTGPSVYELQRAGILDDVRALGLQNSDECWRKVDGEIIAGLNRDFTPQGPLNPVTLDQFRLETVILKHLEAYPHAKILWGHKVVGLERTDEIVTVTAAAGGETKSFTGSYVIGADGGKSTMRKLIGVKFDGMTWLYTIRISDLLITVATNVYYPFRENGFWSAQFVVDPEHRALICHLEATGLWRVSYGEKEGLTTEEYMERLPAKFETLFRGEKPIAGQYELKSMSPYRIHQRCADTFCKGRVVLAGDAAHLCNPFGGSIFGQILVDFLGLGLTGGMLDAGCLADALEGIYNENQPDSIQQSIQISEKRSMRSILILGLEQMSRDCLS
jgi:2-polyprenyl-6-methoxyphenol hydroxylase-like FAD-dependent oxidoreductase